MRLSLLLIESKQKILLIKDDEKSQVSVLGFRLKGMGKAGSTGWA